MEEDDGLTDRERKKLRALMDREAAAVAKAARKRGGRKPAAETNGSGARAAAPPFGGGGGGGASSSSSRARRKKGEGVDRWRLTPEENLRDLHAHLDGTSATDLAALNAGHTGVLTIFSLSGYRAYASWKEKEFEALERRQNQNSFEHLERNGRLDARRRRPAAAPPPPEPARPRPRPPPKRAASPRDPPPPAKRPTLAPKGRPPKRTKPIAAAAGGASASDAESDDIPISRLAKPVASCVASTCV